MAEMTDLDAKVIELAASIMFNSKAECEATEFYTNLQKLIGETVNLAESEGRTDIVSALKGLSAEIDEIISDELNHQQRLFAAYIRLTDIDPAKT